MLMIIGIAKEYNVEPTKPTKIDGTYPSQFPWLRIDMWIYGALNESGDELASLIPLGKSNVANQKTKLIRNLVYWYRQEPCKCNKWLIIGRTYDFLIQFTKRVILRTQIILYYLYKLLMWQILTSSNMGLSLTSHFYLQ